MKLEVIRDHCNRPYLVRLVLFTLFGWSVRFHVFLMSDEDRELHDHPWGYWSMVLAGTYREIVPCDRKVWGYDFDIMTLPRKRFRFKYHPATYKHRVLLLKEYAGAYQSYRPIPCLTLVITKPKSRNWGFWKKDPAFNSTSERKFIHNTEFQSNIKCD